MTTAAFPRRWGSLPTIASLRRGSGMAASIDTSLASGDPAIAALIGRELERQQTHLELIASENFASRAVM